MIPLSEYYNVDGGEGVKFLRTWVLIYKKKYYKYYFAKSLGHSALRKFLYTKDANL